MTTSAGEKGGADQGESGLFEKERSHESVL